MPYSKNYPLRKLSIPKIFSNNLTSLMKPCILKSSVSTHSIISNSKTKKSLKPSSPKKANSTLIKVHQKLKFSTSQPFKELSKKKSKSKSALLSR